MPSPSTAVHVKMVAFWGDEWFPGPVPCNPRHAHPTVMSVMLNFGIFVLVLSAVLKFQVCARLICNKDIWRSTCHYELVLKGFLMAV